MRKRDMDRQAKRFARGEVSDVDLIEETAKRAGLPVAHVKRAVNAIFLKHFEALAEHNKSQFYGLGTMQLHIMPTNKFSLTALDEKGIKVNELILECNPKFKVHPKIKQLLSRHLGD